MQELFKSQATIANVRRPTCFRVSAMQLSMSDDSKHSHGPLQLPNSTQLTEHPSSDWFRYGSQSMVSCFDELLSLGRMGGAPQLIPLDELQQHDNGRGGDA